jgi:DHA1 family tetracycline resistance protein-like MFS transporter
MDVPKQHKTRNSRMPQSSAPKKSEFAFIYLTVLLDSIGFCIILPVLPELLMEVTGEGLSAAAKYGGWLVFVFALIQFFCAPIVGNLSDRFGRRPVLLVSLFVLSINYLLMAVAQSLVLLFVGRIVSGMGASTRSTCNAFIADKVVPDDRPKYFGILGAAFGLGFILGPIIGGFLGEFGPRVPFFASAAVAFCNMLFGIFVLRESLGEEHRRPFVIGRANPAAAIRQLSAFPMIIGIIVVMFFYNFSHFVLPSTWAYFTMEKFDWSPKDIGYSLGFIGVLMILVQGFLIRWILPALGARLTGVIGLTFNVVAFFGYAIAATPVMMYAAMVPGALGGLAGPAMQGIATSQLGPSQQGELQGGIESVMSITSILGPLIMTQTFGYFTSSDAPVYFPSAAFVLAGGLALVSLLIFARTTRGLDPTPSPHSS